MPTEDKIEINCGFESAGEEPAFNTVAIRCTRDGEPLIASDCQNVAEVEEVRRQMESMDFKLDELDSRAVEIERHLGMTRELCRGCDATLFRKTRLPTGGWAMDSSTRTRLESEGGERFFRCKECGGRNYVIKAGGSGGGTTLEICGFKK